MDIATHAQPLQGRDGVSHGLTLADEACPGVPAQDRQGAVTNRIKFGDEAIRFALLGDKGDLVTHRVAWRSWPIRLAAQAHRTMLHAFEPVQRAKEPAAARAGETVEAKHLTTEEIEAHLPQATRRTDAAHLQNGRSFTGGGCAHGQGWLLLRMQPCRVFLTDDGFDHGLM